MEKEITKKIRAGDMVLYPDGAGFRPTVSRHADSCEIRGSVSNRGPYVRNLRTGKRDGSESVY